MGWTSVPPATGTDIQAYDWIKQFWKATQERAWAANAATWPQSNFIWASGTITNLVNNNDGTYTLTDSGASNTVNRFYGYSNPSAPYAPAYYDLIIDNEFDETLCFHTQILGNTSTTFKITDVFADALTEGWLSSVSSLVGAKYYIIKRGGLWWHERWLIWPNDSEAWVGASPGLSPGARQPMTSLTSSGTTATAVVTNHGFIAGDSVTIAGATSSNGRYNGTFTIAVVDANTFTYTLAGADSSPATGTNITATEQHTGAYDASATYQANAYQSGFELMVYGSDGALKRITLTGNDANNLYFSRPAGGVTVSGQYAVVLAGRRYRNYQKFFSLNTSPGITADCNPYAGPPFRWYHGPWDLYYSHYPDDSIGQTKSPTQSITLNDASGAYTQNIYDEDVWTAFDDTFNPPDTNYTPDLYRTLRGIQDALESLCVNYCAPHSWNGYDAIPTFTPATWLYYAGINGYSANTSTVDGSGGINLAGSVGVPYTPVQVYYCVQNVDGSTQSSGIATLDTTSHLTPDNPDGHTFTTSDESKQIVLSLGWTRKYPNEFLYLYGKQCFIPDWNGTGWQDPPTSAHPGQLLYRGPSTHYKEHDAQGMVRDSNGTRGFVTNDYARYSGDNWNDPTIHPEMQVGSSSVPYTYYNNLYEGKLSPTNQAARDALKSGTVTGTPWNDNNSSIQDTTKNWWPGGVLITESGTATGGSTTDLSDSSKSTNGFWTSQSGFRWVNLILEFTVGGVTYRRPISTQSGITDLQWTQAAPVSASGASYQIRTPKYEINTWNGRQLTLTFPDGSVHTTTINFNDDNTLYFNPLGVAIPVGTTYQITEIEPGGVWKWNGLKWVAPSGNDPRTGTAWLADQTADLPTYNTKYGKLMKGDYFGPHVWTELYNALQALVWLPTPIVWTANGNTNYKTGGNGGQTIFANAVANAKAAYNASGSNSNAAPFALSYTDYNCACYSYDVARRYAFAKVQNLDTRQAASVDYYILAAVPTALDGSTGTLTSNGSCPAIEDFDAMGDGPPLQLGYFELVTSSGPATASTQTSPQIGSLSMPTDIGPAPANCSPVFITCDWFQGWMTYKSQAIIKKNVPGGFQFQ